VPDVARRILEGKIRGRDGRRCQPVTSSNFAITYTGPSECIAYDQAEINLNVDWAHATAPGAHINLVVTKPRRRCKSLEFSPLSLLSLGEHEFSKIPTIPAEIRTSPVPI
jgi:hypothetical protein